MAEHTKLIGVAGDRRCNPRAGVGGRPRVFQDEDFFQATTRLAARAGYRGLTLAAVARELGCSGTAISRRFGSKHGLVSAYLEWSLATMAARFQAMRAAHASPLAALRARGVIPAAQRPEEIGDPLDSAHQANLATFWVQVRADPALRTIVDRHLRRAEGEAVDLLREAVAAGELTGCEPTDVGRALTVAWVGTTVFWSGDGADGSLEDRLGEIFDTIVGPYRPQPTAR